MSTMIDLFFGISQAVVRDGLWRAMKPSEKDLYVYLMYESQRRSTRELILVDQQITEMVGTSPRALRDARIKLQERGLIQVERVRGRGYQYVICNPSTGVPWPGSHRKRLVYRKKSSGGRGQFGPSWSAGHTGSAGTSELTIHGSNVFSE
jgi:hypothetical protein